MVQAFEETQSTILGSEVVEGDAICNYGCLDCTPTPPTPASSPSATWLKSPKPGTQPSQNAIIGRYILTPRIFSMIETITPGAGGELQLTDAIKALLQHEKVYGYSYTGKRHDAGDKQGFLRATVELGLKHPTLGPDFRALAKILPRLNISGAL